MLAAGVQHSYGMLMDACASVGDLTACQKVLDSIAADGLVPNGVVWNAFLKARLFSPRDGLEVGWSATLLAGRAQEAATLTARNRRLPLARSEPWAGLGWCQAPTRSTS